MSTPRSVKRLMDLEIDEVSLVDRPANQHGLVSFTKRAEENSMGIYDAAGVEVLEDELEHGDVVYDDAGNEFVFVEDDADDTTAELQSGGEYEDEDDLALVGKSAAGDFGRRVVGGARQRLRGSTDRATAASTRFGRQANSAFSTRATRAKDRAGQFITGQYGARPGTTLAVAGGGTAAAGGGAYYGGRRRGVEKSLGQSVYEELSKALTAGDQHEVIAKMANEVEVYKSQAEYALEQIEVLQEQQELEEFAEIAKGYGLPTDPYVLGSILKSASETMDDAELRELDRLLTSQGELYDELGTDLGLNESSVHGQIEAMALETVGKADMGYEDAVVALYEANPAAYDEYLAEQGR